MLRAPRDAALPRRRRARAARPPRAALSLRPCRGRGTGADRGRRAARGRSAKGCAVLVARGAFRSAGRTVHPFIAIDKPCRPPRGQDGGVGAPGRNPVIRLPDGEEGDRREAPCAPDARRGRRMVKTAGVRAGPRRRAGSARAARHGHDRGAGHRPSDDRGRRVAGLPRFRDDLARLLGRAAHRQAARGLRVGQEMTQPVGRGVRQPHLGAVAGPVALRGPGDVPGPGPGRGRAGEPCRPRARSRRPSRAPSPARGREGRSR